MKSPRLEALNQGIRTVLKDDMGAAGFRYEASTRTLRRQAGEYTQIVNFQVGVRSLAGKFTVNLGVFHPTYWAAGDFEPQPGNKPREFHCLLDFRWRLGHLIETPITRFFRRRIQQPDTFLKWWLVTSPDKWWSFSEDPAHVRRSLLKVKPILLDRALPWLESKSNVDALKAAFDARRDRAEAWRARNMKRSTQSHDDDDN